MSRATLKPIISKLREIIIKDIAGKMEKYGFDDSGRNIANKPLSEYDSVIKNNLVSLFKGKNIEGNKKEYIAYIQDSARTFLHILICFKTMEQRGIMGNVVGRLMNDYIYDTIIPDFNNVHPLAFTDLSNKYYNEVSKMEEKDHFEEDREYYNFIFMLSSLTREMAKEVPLLFKDYEHNLVHPDFDGLKETLFNINKIEVSEYLEDDFLGWIYQYWVDIKDDELKTAEADVDVSYANSIFYEILNNLEEEQTQFGEYYTPRWVVKYIVDNTLKPYFEENRKIETIKLLDPACGAGNFLVYAFDVFYELYKIEYSNWTENLIIESILKNNIFGVDIQREPLQITAINLWLKAKKKSQDVRIQNLNFFNMNILKANSLYRWENDQEEIIQLSLFQTDIELTEKIYTAEDIGQYISAQAFIAKKEARIFFRNKFNIIVMNPPFVDARKMDSITSEFLKSEYPNNSRNLFSAFIERSIELVSKKGLIGFISSDTFMYLGSFDKTRAMILRETAIKTILTLGRSVFEGPTVDASISIFEKGGYKSRQILCSNLTRALNGLEKKKDVITVAIAQSEKYEIDQSKFRKIISYPFLYDISDEIRSIFAKSKYLGVDELSPATIKAGMQTGKNEKYLYKKWQLPKELIGTQFYPYAKGGGFSKYSNDLFDYIDWRDNAKIHYNTSKKARKNYLSSYFSENDNSLFLKGAITYSDITSENIFSARLLPPGCIFDVKGSCIFSDEIDNSYLLGFINCKFVNYILKKLNPSPSFQVGDLQRVPYKIPTEELKQAVIIRTNRARELKEYLLGFNYLSDYYHNVELAFGFNQGAATVLDAYKLYIKKIESVENELFGIQKEINEIIYKIYELSEEDIKKIEEEIPDKIMKPKDNNIKYAVVNYLRMIVKDSINNKESKLFTDEEIVIIIKKYIESKFMDGYLIINEIEAILERRILNFIRGGVKIGSSITIFAGKRADDSDEPLLQQKVLSGTGVNKQVIIWHLSQFLLEFDEDKKYVMQNEIRRLNNEVFRFRLQNTKEKLQENMSVSVRKDLEKQEKQLLEAVRTLEAWKVIN